MTKNRVDPRADAIRSGYAPIASAYASHLSDELSGKPLDRALLDVFAESTHKKGPVLEVGCGPGQIAAYLRLRGVDVEGIDLSPHMIEEARKLHDDIPFRVGDMGNLPHQDSTLAGIVAFYAIVHRPSEELDTTFNEFHRILQPNGLAIIAFHAGNETRHVEELWGCATSLDFWFHRPDAVIDKLKQAGFVIDARLDREPYPDAEHPSTRTYLFARRVVKP